MVSVISRTRSASLSSSWLRDEADLLLGREQQLEPCVRVAFRDDAPRRLEHDRDRRLVVPAENGAGGVADDAVLDHGLDRAGGRDGVEVRAEEDRRAAVHGGL